MSLTGKAILEINPDAKVHIVQESGSSEETINWLDGTAEISQTDIDAKKQEIITRLKNEEDNKENLKASAKAKLVAGTPLTEDEANVMIGG